MDEGPIMKELRRTRREIMKECDNDFDKYIRHLREVEASGGHPTVYGKPKPISDTPIEEKNVISTRD